jgi:hypothetical protein
VRSNVDLKQFMEDSLSPVTLEAANKLTGGPDIILFLELLRKQSLLVYEMILMDSMDSFRLGQRALFR